MGHISLALAPLIFRAIEDDIGHLVSPLSDPDFAGWGRGGEWIKHNQSIFLLWNQTT